MHTIYFWSRPEVRLGEIFRAMSPGGRVVLGYRPLEDAGFAERFPVSVYLIRSVKEIETLTGFEAVRTESREAPDGLMAWAIAQKPEKR